MHLVSKLSLLAFNIVERCGRAKSLAAVLVVVAIASLSACSTDHVVSTSFADEVIGIVDHGVYASGSDWAFARDDGRAALMAARSEPEKLSAIYTLVRAAGGKHSRYLTVDEVAEEASQDALPVAWVPTVSVADGIGTLAIPTFSSSDSDNVDRYLSAAGESILTAATSVTCGWEVDLRYNPGGKNYVMLAAVLPFFEPSILLNEKYRATATMVPVAASNEGLLAGGELLFRRGEQAPDLSLARVAVLQSAQTASAAEHLLVAFSGRENTRSFGQASAGLTTLNDLYEVSDGSAILLSIGVLQGAMGTVYDGPIQPDVIVAGGPPGNPKDAEVAAHDWLKSTC